jgi:hypothetical protein
VLSGVLHGSALGPFLFNIFINDVCDVINHSNRLIFADDFKVYRAMNSPSGCLLLQPDIGCVHEWRSANLMNSLIQRATLNLILI